MAVVALQGSMIGRKEKNGPNGSGFNQDTSFTLNTVDRHAVAYGIDRLHLIKDKMRYMILQ